MNLPKRPAVTPVINQYLPLGSRPRQRFDELSAKCDAEVLFNHSLLACLAAYHWPKRSIYEMYGTSASELRKLPAELEELACKIDRVSGLMSSFISAKVIDNDQAPLFRVRSSDAALVARVATGKP